MKKSGMLGPTIFVGVCAAALALVSGVVYAVDNKEAPASCYEDLSRVYTWQHRIPELDEIWKDRKITQGECDLIQEIYQDATVEGERNKVDEVRNTLGKAA